MKEVKILIKNVKLDSEDEKFKNINNAIEIDGSKFTTRTKLKDINQLLEEKVLLQSGLKEEVIIFSNMKLEQFFKEGDNEITINLIPYNISQEKNRSLEILKSEKLKKIKRKEIIKYIKILSNIDERIIVRKDFNEILYIINILDYIYNEGYIKPKLLKKDEKGNMTGGYSPYYLPFPEMRKGINELHIYKSIITIKGYEYVNLVWRIFRKWVLPSFLAFVTSLSTSLVVYFIKSPNNTIIEKRK